MLCYVICRSQCRVVREIYFFFLLYMYILFIPMIYFKTENMCLFIFFTYFFYPFISSPVAITSLVLMSLFLFFGCPLFVHLF